MRRAKTVLQLPVVSLADGLRIGIVRDILFDCAGRRIAAFIVAEAGWLKDTQVIPMEQVRSYGRDALTVFNSQSKAIVPASSIRAISRLLHNGVCLTGLHMLTEGGDDLGTIEEIFIAPDGGMVGYEISAGIVRDTMHGRRFVPATEALTVGPDAAIVPDHVEQFVLDQDDDYLPSLEASEPKMADVASPVSEVPSPAPPLGEGAVLPAA
ncbi:MAG: PRC-barrel domain-containing protein [Chloroflexi bacterium]|nr:PRC-barrel domain-containing protein [Chloroflexota bacterium]